MRTAQAGDAQAIVDHHLRVAVATIFAVPTG